MVKRCTTRTVLGMLNKAAQKFIFTLEKKLPWVWGALPRCPPPPVDPPLCISTPL